jgi:hypothetical protein
MSRGSISLQLGLVAVIVLTAFSMEIGAQGGGSSAVGTRGLPGLCDASDVIVEGVVQTVFPALPPGTGGVSPAQTDLLIRVSRVLKGSVPESIVIVQYGPVGQGDRDQSGSPMLKPTERVIVFLTTGVTAGQKAALPDRGVARFNVMLPQEGMIVLTASGAHLRPGLSRDAAWARFEGMKADDLIAEITRLAQSKAPTASELARDSEQNRIPALCDVSEVIVEGTVQKVFPAMPLPGSNATQTDLTLRVVRVLKGSAPESIVITQFGTPRDPGNDRSGIKMLQPSDRVIVWLTTKVDPARTANLPDRGVARFDVVRPREGLIILTASGAHIGPGLLSNNVWKRYEGMKADELIAEVAILAQSNKTIPERLSEIGKK